MGLTSAATLARQAVELGCSIARTRLQRADVPRLLTYIVTFRCNARCVMCDSWRKDGEGDLTIAEIESIFRQLPHLHAVRLTGGEPFVRKDFAEIAELALAHLRPRVLHVTSNGFLTERLVKFCESRENGTRATPLELLVSIDGVGEKHNQIRGRREAFDQAMDTVRALGPRQRELNLHLGVNQTVVDEEGASQYRALRALLQPLGVQNQVVVAYEASATYSLDRKVDLAPRAPGAFTTFGELGKQALAGLFDEIEQDLAEQPLGHRLAKRYYLDGIRGRLLQGHDQPNPPCVALGAHMRLFPNGDVPTCQFNTHTVGNLRTQTFAQLWASAAAEQQRAWVRRCPGCWAECEVLPSAIYSGDLLRVVRGRARAAADRGT